ncbi:MAG: hypothetical protein EA401_02085, partial [Planctomycetota bacterium]
QEHAAINQHRELLEDDHQQVWLPQQGHAQAVQDSISLGDMPEALDAARTLAQEAIASNSLSAIHEARQHLQALQFQVHNMTVRLGPHWSTMELQAFLVEHRIHDLFRLDVQLRERHAHITRMSLLWP